MTERGVDFLDVRIRDTLGLQILLEDLVGGAGIHVVGAEEVEFLLTFAEHVVHRRDGLLVHRFGRVEDVLRQFFALILDGVEEEAVVAFEHGQAGLATNGSPAAEDDGDLVFHEQLFGLFGEQGPVGCGIDDDGFDENLFAADLDAAGLVDLVEREEQHVLGEVSLMAIVPLKEWSTPTFTVSAAIAAQVSSAAVVPRRSLDRIGFMGS